MTADKDLYDLRSKVKEINYYKGYYSQLIGAKVVGFEMYYDEEDDYGFAEGWPVLLFEKDGQQIRCEISKDEEGNGPGFMFGLNHVSHSDHFLKAVDEMNEEQLVLLLNRIEAKPPVYANSQEIS